MWGHSWDDTKDHLLCSCMVFDDTEFAKLVQSVLSFCVWWCSNVAKKRTTPEKCNIYAKVCKNHDSCDLSVSFSPLSLFLLFLFVVIVVAAVVIYKLNFLKKKVYPDTFVSRVRWKNAGFFSFFTFSPFRPWPPPSSQINQSDDSDHLTEEEEGTITVTLNTAILIKDNPAYHLVS